VEVVSTAPVLRPLGVGEILDTALAVYRRHAFSLWRIVAVVLALPAALTGVIAVAQHQIDNSSDSGANASLIVLSLVTELVGLLATFLATAAAYRLVADAYMGREVDPAASLRFGLRRLGAVLWVSLLAGLGILGGLILFVVPAIYLAVCWSIAVPVLLGENLRGRRALSRSRALVRGRWWPCAGVLMLAVILALVVALGFSLLLNAIVGDTNSEPVIFLTSGITSLISDALVLPFQVAVTTVLYIDLRVRKEGFDVQLMTHALDQDDPGET
jgi:Membrane domain of glycerophosphoryl diester phosphodiesterase